MEFIYEYGLFLAKSITFIIALAVIIGLITSAGSKSKSASEGDIEVVKLNEHYTEMQDQMKAVIHSTEQRKQAAKEDKKQKKLQKKAQRSKDKAKTEDEKDALNNVYVVDFDGDIKASAVDSLREEVTAILSLATPEDEVVVKLESAGGMVHSYGLASSQLARIKEKGIPLTVCVDKVAASGGYMMACVADTICAAPFSIIGSIGVVAQLPNFHRLLKKNDVDFELLTAGEYKRTLTMFGENTDKGREKFVEDLEKTHGLFKDFVQQQRPVVNIDQVSTGEIWFGTQAKEEQLIDRLTTSDDYIIDKVISSHVFSVTYRVKKNMAERLGINAQQAIESSFNRLLSSLNVTKYF